MLVHAIIPARMASSRFPGKPLKKILGLPMIEHVRRRALMCREIDKVVVATCDKEIYDLVLKQGGECLMTSKSHNTCIDRVGEVVGEIGSDIIINLQGDMPLVDPDSLTDLIRELKKNNEIKCVDLTSPILKQEEANDINVVKVVNDKNYFALYYSRSPIPAMHPGYENKVAFLKQLGINIFKKDLLMKFLDLSQSPLEKIESIDMLRLLENNYKVKLIKSYSPSIGVDLVSDIEKAEKMLKKDKLFGNY